MKITFASDIQGDPEEIGKSRREFTRYPPTVHSMILETRYEILEGNELRKLQESDEVWSEVIKWVLAGKTPKMQELRGNVQKVLSVRQIFNPMLFVIHNGVLCYNRHTDPTKPYNALHVCVPKVKVKEAFKICHEGVSAGHRALVGTLDKFQRTFIIMSVREKIWRCVEQ